MACRRLSFAVCFSRRFKRFRGKASSSVDFSPFHLLYQSSIRLLKQTAKESLRHASILYTGKSSFLIQICQDMSLIDANIILTRISRIRNMYQVFNPRYPRNPRQEILFIYFNLRLSDSNLVCEVVPIDACRFPKRSASVAG